MLNKNKGDIEWFALEMNRDYSVVFETAFKYYILNSLIDCDGYSISSKGFLPTVVDIMVICCKFTHSHPFQITDFQDVDVYSCCLLLDHVQFALIHERLLLNHAKMPGFLAPGGEEFNLGPEMRLDRSELLCNKVLLKYKGDRESFLHRHQSG